MFLNEKGRLGRHATLTYFLLVLMPFILGIIFTIRAAIEKSDAQKIFMPWLIFQLYIFTILFFVIFWKSKRKEWEKAEEI